MNYLKQLKIVHLAMIISTGFLIIISAFFIWQGVVIGNIDKDAEEILEYLVPALAFILPFTAITYFYYKTKDIRENLDNTAEKKEKYRSVSVFKMTMLEAASMFAIVAFLLSGNIMFFILSLVVFLLMLLQMPADYKVIRDINVRIEDL